MNILKKSRLLLVIGATIVAAASQASMIDATILIDRAANNKTLTVRYDGASATTVEMRINGRSVASRPVSDQASSGETNFDVDVASLEDGENTVEIRLYDKSGKLLGTEKSTLTVDRSGTGPVFITAPKKNDTVQGYVDIKVGFKQQLKNVYVSFFINDDFKILKNFPPYSYSWDTTSVANGWHEVQAWVVDESNATFKTEKLRLFVNNPGGLTKRESTDPTKTGPAATKEPVNGSDVKAPVKPTIGNISEQRTKTTGQNLGTGTRNVDTQAPGKANAKNATPKAPILPPVPTTENKTINTAPNKPATQTNPKTNPDLNSLNPVGKTALPVAVEFGTKVNYEGTFDIFMDGEAVNFDVSPRVVDGVPISPFRHLFEHTGGEVKWENGIKTVTAKGNGLDVMFQIGDPAAKVNGQTVVMELSPYLLAGRSMVPLSFMSEALKVNVRFDASTGHVLILSNKSK